MHYGLHEKVFSAFNLFNNSRISIFSNKVPFVSLISSRKNIIYADSWPPFMGEKRKKKKKNAGFNCINYFGVRT